LGDLLRRAFVFRFAQGRGVNEIEMPPDHRCERRLIALPDKVPQQFKIG
jgi:hypothetical protein